MQPTDLVDQSSLRTTSRTSAPATRSRSTSGSSRARRRASRCSRASSSVARAAASARPSPSARSPSASASSAPSRVHTPIIDKIEVVTRGDVRRAKLYYLRDLRGKAAKIKEKRERRSLSADRGAGRRLASVDLDATTGIGLQPSTAARRDHPARDAGESRSHRPAPGTTTIDGTASTARHPLNARSQRPATTMKRTSRR